MGNMKLEMTTEGGQIVISVIPGGVISYSRYFWPEAVRREVARMLPHAYVEIERVTVSEK
jgi:hypothetical protein